MFSEHFLYILYNQVPHNYMLLVNLLLYIREKQGNIVLILTRFQ